MAVVTRRFPDGGELMIEYGGQGGGAAVLSADANEGTDRSLELVFMTADGSVSETRSVVQEGRREAFGASDGEFGLADGGAFNVIKEKYALT